MGFIAGSGGGGSRPRAAGQYTPAPRPARGGTVPGTPFPGPPPGALRMRATCHGKAAARVMRLTVGRTSAPQNGVLAAGRRARYPS